MTDTVEVKPDVSRLMVTPPTVHQAWLAVMDEVQAVRKTGRNESQGFNFRGIDAVINAVGPATRKHGPCDHSTWLQFIPEGDVT